ncbi:MAG: amino acid permease [Eubacterium sp.]|jgi:APA family basic amino acid/polyamine antiporter|uniref:APC family permease n=1 Tax=Eubacterium sp. F2 TaxID=3381348 RepID=UPI0039083E97|nr:amino acid permease [Eubacterium sp.]MCI2198099.1 amino acid permease [Eubacterium sp.]
MKDEKKAVSSAPESSSDGLKKNLGVGTALATVIGCVIGSGVFFKPQAIFTTTGGAPGMGILAWLVVGIISICAALTFAEVAVLIPKTGGIVTYIRDIYSPRLGFVCGWVQVLLFYPAMISALAVAFGNQAAMFVGQKFAVPMALVCILILVIVNCISAKAAGNLQIVFTICKLAPIILLIIFGFLKGGSSQPLMSPMIGKGVNPVSAMGMLLVSVLFAFEGWTGVGAIAGELKNPGKDLPRAIVGGVSVITAIYLIVNLAYLKVIPASQLAAMDAPAAAVAIKLFGNVGGKIIAVGIMISVFGACNGFVLSGSRVMYSLAVEGLFPKHKMFAKLNKSQVPVNSIYLISIIGAIYSLSGQFNTLTNLAVFACWTFYTLSFVGCIKLRKDHPEWKRTYKVPLYPIVPAIAIASGLFVVVDQLFLAGLQTTILSACSIVVMLIGVPVYKALENKLEKEEASVESKCA